MQGNAFYCSAGDFVAWDEQTLLPKLRDQFGDFAVALVLAHEWGHAIQARTDTRLNATVYLEMQADCFAGAWTRHIANGPTRRCTSVQVTSTPRWAGSWCSVTRSGPTAARAVRTAMRSTG